jgi:hypothetical protein
MTYAKKISRTSPGLIAFMLDESGSMQENMPGTTDAKYKWVERYVGILFKQLLALSTDAGGGTLKVKPRYFVHVILYGSRVKLWGDPLMDIETAITKYTEAGKTLGLGGRLGGTYADAALCEAQSVLAQAVADPRFESSFPPMAFHLTDGKSHSDPTSEAEKIKQLATADGNVLMVNAFIGTQTSLNYQGPEDFPGYTSESEAGPSEDNIRMYRMSSCVPECIRENLIADGNFPKLRDNSSLFFDVRTKEMLKNVIQTVSSIGSRADK